MHPKRRLVPHTNATPDRLHPQLDMRLVAVTAGETEDDSVNLQHVDGLQQPMLQD